MQHSIQSLQSTDSLLLAKKLGLDVSSARIEVQYLLQYILSAGRAFLIAHPERVLSDTEFDSYFLLFQRRLQGEPIAYILGHREFYGLDFLINPATLIPRPETELLVDIVLKRSGKAPRVLDLGTGCGAIALSVAYNRPHAKVWACDISSAALTTARDNANRLNISNVSFFESDWFFALGDHRFDFIVSNPPYIADTDDHLTLGDVRFEPISALTSGIDGLTDIRSIISQANTHLLHNGLLLIEHGYNQAGSVRDILKSAGFIDVFSEKDLSGIERCSGGVFCTY